jgi:hypothetical protein
MKRRWPGWETKGRKGREMRREREAGKEAGDS